MLKDHIVLGTLVYNSECPTDIHTMSVSVMCSEEYSETAMAILKFSIIDSDGNVVSNNPIDALGKRVDIGSRNRHLFQLVKNSLTDASQDHHTRYIICKFIYQIERRREELDKQKKKC